MTFTENWYFTEDCQALTELASRAPAGAIVEVGCWEGKSTVTLAQAVAPRTVHAVDTWEGSPGEISWDLAHERDVYERFLTNTDPYHVEAHVMGWQQFFADWTEPVAFLHIDAEHTYPQVAGNIEAALPHMVPGGIICGDDAHHPPVIAAARDLLGNVNLAGAKLWWVEVT